MSMIARYKKPGGFIQLVKLIETSGSQKQEKFLKIVEEESPAWAEAIKSKMLTLEKVMEWRKESLAEVFSRLTDITLSISYHVISQEHWKKISETFSHSKMRQLTHLIDEKSPSDGEKSTAIINILTEVRTMISDGYVRLDAVDPTLIIEDDIEDKLGDLDKHSTPSAVSVDMSKIDTQINNTKGGDLGDIRKEILQLKQKVIILGNENNNLRKENKSLHDIIEKIKKLAA